MLAPGKHRFIIIGQVAHTILPTDEIWLPDTVEYTHVLAVIMTADSGNPPLKHQVIGYGSRTMTAGRSYR